MSRLAEMDHLLMLFEGCLRVAIVNTALGPGPDGGREWGKPTGGEQMFVVPT